MPVWNTISAVTAWMKFLLRISSIAVNASSATKISAPNADSARVVPYMRNTAPIAAIASATKSSGASLAVSTVSTAVKITTGYARNAANVLRELDWTFAATATYA